MTANNKKLLTEVQMQDHNIFEYSAQLQGLIIIIISQPYWINGRKDIT